MALARNRAGHAESAGGPMSGASSPADVPRGQTPGRGRSGQVAAVVLAAGAATRFGAPKQRLLLPAVLGRLREAAVEDVVVAAGAYPLEAEGVRVFPAGLGAGAGRLAALRARRARA